MNKIKVLYDVVRVMRDKDAYNGLIEVSASKDEAEILQLRNEFSKDLASGWTKASITTVLDHDGKQLKHESTTQFNKKDDSPDTYSNCFEHLPSRRKHQHFHSGHASIHSGGLKAKLERLMALLNALNNLQVVEQDDKSILLSLDLTDIPEDLKKNIQERIMLKNCAQADFLKGSPSIENGTFSCRVNQKYEVETIAIKLKGKLQCASGETHALSGQASIVFAWQAC